jgi:hypothetical protein
MAPRKTKKEQNANRKAALQKKMAEQRRKAMELKVSQESDDDDALAGKPEEVEAYDEQTNSDDDDDLGSNPSRKHLKRKSPPTSNQASTHTERPNNNTVVSNDNKSCNSTDNNSQKQPARTSPTLNSNQQQNEDNEKTQSPAELRAVLIETEGQLVRAERQVRAISKTRVADTFLEGQVRAWTKETLWKMCKFITNDQTMHKVMRKASKHFKVPDLEQEHWMSSYAHIVRDGLNQKRNACSQDLRKTIKSKCQGATMDYLRNCLTMCL